MTIHLGQIGTPHPHHTLPPPSLGVLQLQILKDRCIDHPVPPNAGDNPPICPMGGLGDPALAQTHHVHLAATVSQCQKTTPLQHYVH